jgi:TRAP-type C4-dicarboxylate transport system substrate-binding protein
MAPTRRWMLAATGAAPLIGRAAAAQFDWVLPHAAGPATPLHIRLSEAAARVARESDGRLTIRVLPAGERGNSVGLLAQLRAGTIPLCALATQALAEANAGIALPSIGFAWPAPDRLWAALDGELGAAIREQAATRVGLVLMGRAWDGGFRHLLTRARPVRNPDDFTGLRLRVPSDGDTIALFDRLGASPLPLAS